MNYPVHGIDGSRYQFLLDAQGKIVKAMDMDKALAQGISFVFWRLSVGDYYLDKTFSPVYAWCKDNGIPIAPYHVTKGVIGWREQIQWVDKCLGAMTFALPLIQDLEIYEADDRAYTTNTQAIVKWADDRWGRPSIIYTNLWANTYLRPWSGWNEHPLIAASWLYPNAGPGKSEPLGQPILPRWWDEATFWQWSADKPVSNQAGPRYGACSPSLDLDVFMGTEAEWKALTGGMTVQPPAPEPEPTSFRVEITSPAGLNVRSAPGIGASKIGALRYREQSDVINTLIGPDSRDWYQIEYKGQPGFVASWYTRKV